MDRVLWGLEAARVCEHAAQVLAAADEALRLEQAVRGIDAWDERRLQEELAAGLGGAYTVAREVHYPSSLGARLTHRARCDLVLGPHGAPRALEHVAPTLFDAPGCAPEDALWLEVKLARQLREDGRRHRGYGAQWRQAVVADLRKMQADPRIHSAALLLVVFSESEDILDKDCELFERVLVQKDVLAGFRTVRRFPIVDRVGHRLCGVALWPAIRR